MTNEMIDELQKVSKLIEERKFNDILNELYFTDRKLYRPGQEATLQAYFERFSMPYSNTSKKLLARLPTGYGKTICQISIFILSAIKYVLEGKPHEFIIAFPRLNLVEQNFIGEFFKFDDGNVSKVFQDWVYEFINQNVEFRSCSSKDFFDEISNIKLIDGRFSAWAGLAEHSCKNEPEAVFPNTKPIGVTLTCAVSLTNSKKDMENEEYRDDDVIKNFMKAESNYNDVNKTYILDEFHMYYDSSDLEAINIGRNFIVAFTATPRTYYTNENQIILKAILGYRRKIKRKPKEK